LKCGRSKRVLGTSTEVRGRLPQPRQTFNGTLVPYEAQCSNSCETGSWLGASPGGQSKSSNADAVRLYSRFKMRLVPLSYSKEFDYSPCPVSGSKSGGFEWTPH
jgi:hypothetical protein